MFLVSCFMYVISCDPSSNLMKSVLSDERES